MVNDELKPILTTLSHQQRQVQQLLPQLQHDRSLGRGGQVPDHLHLHAARWCPALADHEPQPGYVASLPPTLYPSSLSFLTHSLHFFHLPPINDCLLTHTTDEGIANDNGTLKCADGVAVENNVIGLDGNY